MTHIQPITFTVATTASWRLYVDIIGFAVFEVTDINSNAISGRAVSGVYRRSQPTRTCAARRSRGFDPW